MTSRFHLSDEQIDDVLMGDLASEPAAHLTGCEPCQLRVATAEAPIASFKAVSLAWGERRSATLPSQLVGPSNSAAWQRRASWTLAATAVLVMAITLPVGRHEVRHAEVVASATAPHTELAGTATRAEIPAARGSNPSGQGQAVRSAGQGQSSDSQDTEIAQDNQMLQAIDRELGASVQSPSDAFGLEAVGGQSTGHGRFVPAGNWE